MSEVPGAPVPGSVFFTKQPILDAKRSIWGYELLGGEIREGVYQIFPRQEGAATLSSSTFMALQEAMERGKKIMASFDHEAILAGVPYVLPPASGVVRVLPGVSQTPGLESALEKLRSDGYQTVIEVTPQRLPAIDYSRQADILSVDLAAGPSVLASLQQTRPAPTLLLVRGVMTREQFQDAKDMDFALFQGAFFKAPEWVRDRQLNSNEVARLNLLRLMEAEDPDVKALADAIRSDVSISFRLLSYLNSAWFGLRHTIQSIDQAILLLGWVKLKTWLRAVLLVDMAGKEEIPRELAALSLQRAKFLELLAADYDYWGFNPGTLFLMGLFSLMDSILGMPMDHVVEFLPLDVKLKAALSRDPNNEYRPLFELLECLEEGDWPALEALTQKLCLDLGRIKDSCAQARDWANGFYASSATR